MIVRTTRQRARVRTRTSHIVQKPILIPKHRGGPNNCSIGERLLDSDFALCLCPVELRSRTQRRVQMRDVNEFRNTVLSGDVRNRFGTSDMDGIEIEVPIDSKSAFNIKR